MNRLLISTLIFFCAFASHALDTTEEYPLGLSNFEGYTSHAKTEQTLSAVAGYGYSRWLNVSLAVDRIEETELKEHHTHFCLGNFAQVYSGVVDTDVITQIHSESDKVTTTFGTEISHTHHLWTPYFRLHTDIDEDQHTETASLGLSRKIKNLPLELLVQYEQILSETQTHTALGLNYKANNQFELISEVARNNEDEDTTLSVGFIWNQ